MIKRKDVDVGGHVRLCIDVETERGMGEVFVSEGCGYISVYYDV